MKYEKYCKDSASSSTIFKRDKSKMTALADQRFYSRKIDKSIPCPFDPPKDKQPSTDHHHKHLEKLSLDMY